MLKVNKPDSKKASPVKAGKAAGGKVKKVAKKPPQAKQIKDKKDAKKVKKAVEGGLVKKPKGGSPKVNSPKVKVIDEKKLAALKEKRKLKKLEKKQKKAEAKKLLKENTTESKEDAKQNGSDAKPVAAGKKVKPAKKAPPKPQKNDGSDTEGDGEKKTKNVQIKPKQTVFVGNLPTNTKRIQLVKLFNKFGTILCVRFRTASGKVIFKHKARKESSALNGYVVYDNEESATKALELNNFEFKGHHIRVTPTEVEDQQRDPKRTIVVGNLKYTATDEKLHQIFSSCGEIEYVRTIQNGDKGCNGVGFVCFKDPDAVGLALELKGTVLDERAINVERYKTNKAGAKEKREKEGVPRPGGPNKGPKANGKKAGGKPVPGKPNQKKGGKGKNVKDAKKQKAPAAEKSGEEGTDSKKSKPEFRGVKSTIVKKKQKKVPNAMKKLAKKIAPKDD